MTNRIVTANHINIAHKFLNADGIAQEMLVSEMKAEARTGKKAVGDIYEDKLVEVAKAKGVQGAAAIVPNKKLCRQGSTQRSSRQYQNCLRHSM